MKILLKDKNLGNRAPALSITEISYKITQSFKDCVFKVVAAYCLHFILTNAYYLCSTYLEYGRYIIQYICICLGVIIHA